MMRYVATTTRVVPLNGTVYVVEAVSSVIGQYQSQTAMFQNVAKTLRFTV